MTWTKSSIFYSSNNSIHFWIYTQNILLKEKGFIYSDDDQGLFPKTFSFNSNSVRALYKSQSILLSELQNAGIGTFLIHKTVALTL